MIELLLNPGFYEPPLPHVEVPYSENLGIMMAIFVLVVFAVFVKRKIVQYRKSNNS